MPRTPPTPHAAPDTPDSPQRETLAALAPPCTSLSKKPENDGQGTHESLSLSRSLPRIMISNFRRPSTCACYISSVSRGSSTQDPNRSSECRGFIQANWSSKMREVPSSSKRKNWRRPQYWPLQRRQRSETWHS
jgi:hypothetical protein